MKLYPIFYSGGVHSYSLRYGSFCSDLVCGSAELTEGKGRNVLPKADKNLVTWNSWYICWVSVRLRGSKGQSCVLGIIHSFIHSIFVDFQALNMIAPGSAFRKLTAGVARVE